VLYGEFDLVLIDAGSRVDSVVAAAGPAAHRFITVGGVDPVGLAASYALVKTVEARWPGAPIDLLVNRHTEARARDAFHYVRSATERFLSRGLEYSGTIPEDEELGAVILAGHALAHMAGNTVAGRSMQLVAAKLLSDLDAGTRRESPQQLKNSRRR